MLDDYNLVHGLVRVGIKLFDWFEDLLDPQLNQLKRVHYTDPTEEG